MPLLKSDFVIAFALFIVILTALRLLFDYRLPYLAAIGLYILIYLVVGRVMYLSSRTDPERSQFEKWPTSGPIGRFGQTGLIISFSLSGLLSLLNPFQLWQIVRQAAGNFHLKLQRNENDTFKSATAYRLPFEGEWFVYNGGQMPETSHSWEILTQRYAYDFVKADADFKRHRSRGTSLEDYYCYGEVILAAADGKVVGLERRIRSAPFLGYGIVDFLCRSFIGNYVLIQHAEGEFALYAHLIRDSIHVEIGDQVRQGQALGHCGHSGHSSEPHLHFHVQDGPSLFFSRGLPIRFSNIAISDGPVERANLSAGDIVRNL